MPGQRVDRVPIANLRFGLSPRADKPDPQHVAALVEVIDDLPPVLVHAPTLRVIDGVHRVLAARSAGRSVIGAVMFQGDETAAHVEAVRANIAHGRPLSLAERQAAAARFLELEPEWSDRRIATVTGLSPKTVGTLRTRATVDPAQLRARRGRDGKLRPVDPAEVRRRVADALASDPTASNRAIARHTGASQATVRDVRDRLARGLGECRPERDRRGPRRAGTIGPVGAVGADPAPGALPRAVDDDGDPAAQFGAWFDERRLDEAEWRRFVDALPISRVYEVADACRRRSDSWRAFATALEDRARAHRRSSGPGTAQDRAAG